MTVPHFRLSLIPLLTAFYLPTLAHQATLNRVKEAESQLTARVYAELDLASGAVLSRVPGKGSSTVALSTACMTWSSTRR